MSPTGNASKQNYQAMLKQLGIVAMRPGADPHPGAPNQPNYNEALANPYPNWPDPLVMNNGQPVTSAKMWYQKRRPQIVQAFEEDVYGRVPKDAPQFTWKVGASESERLGGISVVATRVVGHADDSADPAIKVTVPMMVVQPIHHKGRMPVLIEFTFASTSFPRPVPPTAKEVSQINKALKASVARVNPGLAKVFRLHPGWEMIPRPPFFPPKLPVYERPLVELVKAGWAVAMINPYSFQADSSAGLTKGVIGLASHGKIRRPNQWGALRAWAWGAGQVYDYLAKDPNFDSKHFGIEGLSRFGKAALVTMALDPQDFYMGLIGSSGTGGAGPFRRNYGERLTNLSGLGEAHWMAGNFLRYGAAEMKNGAKPLNTGDLPVETSELIALCAPRLVFISYGIPSKGDAKWVDQPGSFMAAVAADPVYRLLGAPGLGVNVNYKDAYTHMPPVGHGLLSGKLAWRQGFFGHADANNYKYFIPWVQGWMKRQKH